jgi:hypothetical protein
MFIPGVVIAYWWERIGMIGRRGIMYCANLVKKKGKLFKPTGNSWRRG